MADTGADTIYAPDTVGFEWRDSMRGRDLVQGEVPTKEAII